MPETAIALIQKAKAERWPKLDLGQCQLKGPIPEEIAELTYLQELIITDQFQRASVRQKTKMEQQGNITQITHLPQQLPPNLLKLKITGTKIEDLTAIASLSNLTELDLYGTLVTNLKPIGTLTRLQTLWLHIKNQYPNPEIDMSPLAHLVALRNLHVSRALIKDLRPLAMLAQLQYLSLPGEFIEDLNT